MLIRTLVLISATLIFQWNAPAQAQGCKAAVRVEIVATASEYVPRSTTVSRPGHSYTNCLGSTDYFGEFHSYDYGYGNSGSISGTADTRTSCKTTFTPPTESTLTTYRRVNYTIARSDQALYLLSCAQTWKPTRKERFLRGLAGAAAGGAGQPTPDRTNVEEGTWTECPAFGIGSQYALTVRSTSDARLEDGYGTKPIKLEYLSSAALPAQTPRPTATQPQPVTASGEAKVHVTSSPSGGEIYIDGKFIGNTPSDITLAVGEHVVKVTIGGKEWSRMVQITGGEIRLHAEVSEK
jgi:hypothetical protein